MPLETYRLLEHALQHNCIKDDADFLDWIPTAVEVRCYQDPVVDIAEYITTNTWFLEFVCDEGTVQLCLERLTCPETEKQGMLSLYILRNNDKSTREGLGVFTKTYPWVDQSTKIKQLLDYALSRNWHQYTLLMKNKTLPWRGQRDHLEAMLVQMQVQGWIVTGTNRTQKPIKAFLALKYEYSLCNRVGSTHEDRPIERGILPAKMISWPT